MEDLRIRKTRKKLKQAMVDLMAQKPFEHISVTELCKAASVSRITFYTYYSDKYELADEYFRDLAGETAQRYAELQRLNNPGGKIVEGYCNLMNAIMDMYERHADFLGHVSPQESPHLSYSYYGFVLHAIEQYSENKTGSFSPRYSLAAETGFLYDGIFSFIRVCRAEKMPEKTVRTEAVELLRNMLESGLLSK